MTTPPLVPNSLQRAINQEWTPDFGIGPNSIQALLGIVGSSLEAVSRELEVPISLVWEVCHRMVPHGLIQQAIDQKLASFGLSHSVVWGSRMGLRVHIGTIPDVFGTLPLFRGPIIPAHHEIVLLADCETSGPDANKHRAVEVALLKVVFDRRPSEGYRILGAIDGYTGLQDPGPHPVNPISMRIHGLGLEDLRGQHLNTLELERVLYGASAVIAHNASFDRRFMSKAIPGLLALKWVCTYQGLSWKRFGFQSANLKALAKFYDLPLPKHRACGDVVTLYHLLDQVLPSGKTVLGELSNTYSDGDLL